MSVMRLVAALSAAGALLPSAWAYHLQTKMSTATFSRVRAPITPFDMGSRRAPEFSPFRPQNVRQPQPQSAPELTPLPELACNMEKIDAYREDVEAVQESIQQALRDGDLPLARRTYHGALQTALKMDPLFTLQQKLLRTKTPEQRDYYVALRDIMQRGSTRFLLSANKIAVLHKGGNGLYLADGQLKFHGPNKKMVETQWKPESPTALAQEIADHVATAPPPAPQQQRGFAGRRRRQSFASQAASVAAANQAPPATTNEMPYALETTGSGQPQEQDQTEKQFQMPTWSPDGRYLAFTELYLNANGMETCCLVVYDVREGREVARKTLPNAPHFLQFMPDSDTIMYMQNQHDNTSFCSLVSVRELRSGHDSERVIDEGLPLFFATSKYQARNFNIVVNNGKRNAICRYLGDMTLPKKAWKQLAVHERKFRVPEVASTGLQDSVLFVVDGHLVCASLDGKYRKNICRVQGFCTFAVSPNGKHIALMEEDIATSFYQLSIISGRDACNPYGGNDYVQKVGGSMQHRQHDRLRTDNFSGGG
jgi:hypothetical protein